MSHTKVEFVLHNKALDASLKQAQEMLEIMSETGEGVAPTATSKTFEVKDKDGNIHLFTFLVLQ